MCLGGGDGGVEECVLKNCLVRLSERCLDDCLVRLSEGRSDDRLVRLSEGGSDDIFCRLLFSLLQAHSLCLLT